MRVVHLSRLLPTAENVVHYQVQHVSLNDRSQCWLGPMMFGGVKWGMLSLEHYRG